MNYFLYRSTAQEVVIINLNIAYSVEIIFVGCHGYKLITIVSLLVLIQSINLHMIYHINISYWIIISSRSKLLSSLFIIWNLRIFILDIDE